MAKFRQNPKNARKYSKLPLFIALILIFTVIIATIIRMYTLDTTILMVKTLELPNLPTLSLLETGDYRQAAISLDGKILQGSGAAPQPTASTAKMILGLAVMTEKPFNLGETGETIVITPEFYDRYLWYASHNGSTVPVVTGEEISQYDALAAVFLGSANNLADSLAIWAFGSLENYQRYATDLLEKIGAKNTTVGSDASGYSETTTSTAEDLTLIATKLLENPVLREIVGLKTHTVPVAGLITNTNQILGTSLENGAVVGGVKTGYIGDISGYNLISSYEKGGHFITAAVLGASTRAASFTESENLLRRLSRELTETTLAEKDTPVGYLETWWNGRHDLTATEEIKVLAANTSGASSPDAGSVAANPDQTLATDLTEETLTITVDGASYTTSVTHEDFQKIPTFIERFLHLFGWHAE